jgi:HEAT repeat protein
MFAEAQRLAAITSTPEITPATVKAAAYLLEATGRMTHRPADPYLRTFIPKNAPYPEAVRAAAIWSLGFLWAGRADEVADLIEQLETRLADIGNPPELVHVRAMAAIALGRFGAESSVPALRQWYEGDGPGSYVGARCGWAITQMTDESFPDPPSPTRRLPGWFLEPPDRLAGG